MDWFGPTGKVSKKWVHLLRWTTFPGQTGWNKWIEWIAPQISQNKWTFELFCALV